MSSAILYLAIIAIWAGFLVPAWVRRPHAQPEDLAPESELSFAEGGLDAESSEYAAEFPDDADVTVRTGVQFEPGEYAQDEYEYYEVEYREEEYVAASYESPDASYEEYAPGPGEPEQPVQDGAGPGDDYYAPQAERPSQSREQMLHARRRMLGILAGMTFVTMAFTALGLVSWWICIPPAGLLVLYVMLLREIAQADTELARKRSAWEQARMAAFERHQQALAERDAYEASLAQPEPDAEIIDISGRVSDADELYDQYADAAVRAVGD